MIGHSCSSPLLHPGVIRHAQSLTASPETAESAVTRKSQQATSSKQPACASISQMASNVVSFVSSPSGPTAETLKPNHSRSLLHRSRRSVPSFLPSLQHLTTLPPLTASFPNVAERHSSEQPCRTPRPDVKSTMPSSVAYSATRNLASDHDRNLNGSYRLAAENMSPEIDDGRSKNNEDIFLNIARSDSLGRSDFRRVSYSVHPVAMLAPPHPWALD